MSEWECVHNVSDSVTHIHIFNGSNYALEYEEKHNIVFDSGAMAEYVADQRGDGWFYVELGQLPLSYDDDILLWNDGRFFVCQYDGINGKYEHRFIGANEHIFIGKGQCARWQPLQPPKYLK